MAVVMRSSLSSMLQGQQYYTLPISEALEALFLTRREKRDSP